MRKQLTDRESFKLAEQVIKHVMKKHNLTKAGDAFDKHNALEIMERVGVNYKIIMESMGE